MRVPTGRDSDRIKQSDSTVQSETTPASSIEPAGVLMFALLRGKLLSALKEYVVRPSPEVLVVRTVNLGAISELVSVTIFVA